MSQHLSNRGASSISSCINTDVAEAFNLQLGSSEQNMPHLSTYRYWLCRGQNFAFFQLTGHVKELCARWYKTKKNQRRWAITPCRMISHLIVQTTMIRCTSCQEMHYEMRFGCSLSAGIFVSLFNVALVRGRPCHRSGQGYNGQ